MLRAARVGAPHASTGLAGVEAALRDLRLVQIDPIDRVGTNADLVLHARVDGVRRGDWARLSPGVSFEHYAKEWCLLPADQFPRYRDQAGRTPDWRLTERLKRMDDGLLEAVLAEVAERGPMSPADLSDRGAVRPLDWSGWTSTGRASTMALQVLAVRCRLVVVGRSAAGQRLYDVPERALPDHAAAPAGPFFAPGVLDRVAVMGLMPSASGPWWSVLAPSRRGPAVDQLLASGRLVEVRVTGSTRTYLALPEHLDVADQAVETDDRMRVLGPLDPLIWVRSLVEQAFDFTYLWEVYKPAAARRWGYYVCPLLHHGRLVGRIEARRTDGGVTVEQTWGSPEAEPLARAIERLAAMQPRRAGTRAGGARPA
jgi:uncharacterized protein YcaQ